MQTESVQTDSAIEIHGFSAGYGDKTVIQNIDTTITSNSITAIIGPSGCGKSTLIRCVNRMHEMAPDAWTKGSIIMSPSTGSPLDLYAKGIDPVMVRRQIGMVFQKANPFPTMSIIENAVAGLVLQGRRLSKAEKQEIAEKCLRDANLWDEVKDKLGATPDKLSGGQQQRLCIARALANEPEILLLDEPCSALDPKATAKIEELIRELKNRITIMIVTHNMAQAKRASDSIIFMAQVDGNPGSIVEQSGAEEMLMNPKHPLTEAFFSGTYAC